MKNLKFTTAALALLAAVSFTTSAHATAGASLILGVYDSNNTGLGSYEANIGTVASLFDGETWALGSTATGVFSSDSGATLKFAIAATGGNIGSAANGLPGVKEIALTTTGTITPPGTGNSTLNTNITALYNEYGASNTTTLTAGSNYTNLSIGNITGSFQTEVGLNGGSYGLASGAQPNILSAYTTGEVVALDEFTSGASSTTEVGTFTVTSTGLTFNTLASTLEPSAYALGMCAMLLFLVLKRRSSLA